MVSSANEIFTRIYNKLKPEHLPFVFLAITHFMFYIIATGKFGDDVYFMTTNPLQDGVVTYVNNLYNYWSSRVIILPVVVALSLAPIWIWRVLDLFVWLLLAACILKLFSKTNATSSNWFLVACMMLYPYWHLGTAGWIATTVNFSWPLAFGMFALLTLKRLREGRKLPTYRLALTVLAFLYATDAEQMVMILLFVFSVLAIHLIYTCSSGNSPPGIYKKSITLGIVILIVRIIFTLSAPGNHMRLMTEMSRLPGFEEFNIFQKLVLGFEVTITSYAVFTLALFPFFALFLLLIIWKKHKNILIRMAALIPFATGIILSAIIGIDAVRSVSEILSSDTESGFILIFFTMIPNWRGMFFIYVLFFACLLFSVYMACDNHKDRFFLIGIILLGFASQMALGFSPSIYASSLRTFIYASFSIIICALYLYERNTILISLRTKILLTSACAVNYGITLAIGILRFS